MNLYIVFVLITAIVIPNNAEFYFEDHDDADSLINLAFDGGMFNGISYVGVLKAFKELGYYAEDSYKIKDINGVSVGCLFGLIISLDIDPELIENFIYHYDFSDDIQEYIQPPPIKRVAELSYWETFYYPYKWLDFIFNFINIWTNSEITFTPGLIDADCFIKKLMSHIVSKSTHKITDKTTLHELYDLTGHNLSCAATVLCGEQNLNSRVFSVGKTPNQSILSMVYASMTIPGIMKPLIDANNCLLIDGGLTATESPSNTLIFSLKSKKYYMSSEAAYVGETSPAIIDGDVKNIITPFDYFANLYSSIIYKNSITTDKNTIYLNSHLTLFDYKSVNKKSISITRAFAETMSYLYILK